jgi:hypothetical protein
MNLKHELVVGKIDWGWIEAEIAFRFSEAPESRPASRSVCCCSSSHYARANTRRRLGAECFKIAAACSHAGLHERLADRRAAGLEGRFGGKPKSKLC